jgi:hypothetical protein
MRILSFPLTYFDWAAGERLPVPAGALVQVATPTWGYPGVAVPIVETGVFPETTIDPDPTGLARVAVVNVRGCSEYQLRKLVT